MITEAYPLRCQPKFQNYLWGGRRLAERLGKKLPDGGVWAESWEIVDHPEHQSIVENGPLAGWSLRRLAEGNPGWLLGPGIKTLPLLLKYLDCQNVLSVQVHPSDDYALSMQQPDLGKTEAWYVIDSRPGAVLYAGLKSGVSREDLAHAVTAGSVEQCLHQIQPQPGDCVFIPAGTVHALGAGLLVAELQQASNTTFRLFDWNRVGPDGQPRALHVQQALAVTDFDVGPRQIEVPQPTSQPGRQRLVSCDKFIWDRWVGGQVQPIAGDGAFHIVTAPYGGVELIGEAFYESLSCGDSAFLPASLPHCMASIAPDAILLDMFLPKQKR
ncbi:MAG: class I mannose-6-phosphate isomerase [Pirellulaceae bacterium]|nr:class I mannose-6-phosphate isomerase [Pirellulaceae bacterium]